MEELNLEHAWDNTNPCVRGGETRQACNDNLVQYMLWSGIQPQTPQGQKQPGRAQKLPW